MLGNLERVEPETLKAMIEALANRAKQEATFLDRQLETHHNNLTELINDTPPPSQEQTLPAQPTRTANDDIPPPTESDAEDDSDARALEASSSHLLRVLDQPRWQH